MTIEDFGNSIKQKYPEYNDIPAADLGQKMLTKYPQYQDLVQSGNPQVTDTFLQGHPILKGISDVLGTTGLAKGATQAIFLNFTPEGKDVQKMLQEGKITQDQFDRIVGGGLATSKEVLGSAIQTGATIATAGLGAPKAASVGGRIAETAAKLGGISALQGGAQEFGKGGTVGQIAKSAAVSGGVGATLGGAGQSIAELAHYLTSPQVTQGIYNKYIGIPNKVIEKGRAPTAEFQSELGAGTKSGLLEKSQEVAQNANKEISNILKNNTQEFGSKDVINQIQDALQEKFQNTLSPNEVKDIIKQLPLNALTSNKSIDVSTLNNLRSELDNQFLGNSKWLNNSTAEKTIALKTATNVMRDIVKSQDSRLPNIFSKYSQAITTNRALNASLAKPHALSNLIEILGSLLYGGATGGLTPEGLKNALESYGIARGVTSAPFGTGIAQGLSKLGELGASTGGQVASGIARTLVPGIAKKISVP